VELVAFEHLRDGEFSGEADDALETEFVQPLGVETDFCLLAVEDAEDLVGVSICILVNLLARERLAGDGAARGVSDERGEIADEEDDLMAEVLKVFELAHQDGVAEMEVGCGGVKPGFDAQGDAGLPRLFEALAQVGDAYDLCRSFLEQV
jgi:hypothetical protein